MNSIIENRIDNPFVDASDPFKYNVIPPMTDPLGKYWDQPDTSRMLINSKYAVMTEKEFTELKDYSNSQPTGVYPGKCWKATYNGWTKLCWFGISDKGEKYCSVNYRTILTSNF